MDETRRGLHSHLFTVRIWCEVVGEGQSEWRGQVQHALSGETRYFRGWSSLVEYLLAMLPAARASGAEDA